MRPLAPEPMWLTCFEVGCDFRTTYPEHLELHLGQRHVTCETCGRRMTPFQTGPHTFALGHTAFTGLEEEAR